MVHVGGRGSQPCVPAPKGRAFNSSVTLITSSWCHSFVVIPRSVEGLREEVLIQGITHGS